MRFSIIYASCMQHTVASLSQESLHACPKRVRILCAGGLDYSGVLHPPAKRPGQGSCDHGAWSAQRPTLQVYLWG